MTNLPYDFDMLFDIKTVEELHDHLTGKQLTATSASHAELIEACHQYGVPLPDAIIPANDSNAPLARRISGLSTLLDICVIQDSLEQAQKALWEQTLKPMFADCKTSCDAKAVAKEILKMRVDHDGTSLKVPAFIDKMMDAEVARIHRASLSNDGPR
jgi:hypothetical protein